MIIDATNFPDLQSAVDAALGNTLYLPAGLPIYNINSPVTINSGITMQGDGPFATWINNLSPSQDLFVVNTPLPVCVRDLAMVGQNNATGGSLLKFDPGAGSNNIASSITNVHMEHGWNHVNFVRASQFIIRDSSFAVAKSDHIVVDNKTNPDWGDSHITGSSLSSNGGNILISHRGQGGLRISNNKMMGGIAAYQMVWGGTSGILKIWGNSIEGQSTAAIMLFKQSGVSASFGTAMICDNQITANGGITLSDNSSSGWLFKVRVCDNDISLTSPGVGIDIGNISNFRIYNNDVLNGVIGYRIQSNAKDGVLSFNSARNCQTWVSGSSQTVKVYNPWGNV